MIVSIVLIPKIMDWLVALYSQYLYQTFKKLEKLICSDPFCKQFELIPTKYIVFCFFPGQLKGKTFIHVALKFIWLVLNEYVHQKSWHPVAWSFTLTYVIMERHSRYRYQSLGSHDKRVQKNVLFLFRSACNSEISVTLNVMRFNKLLPHCNQTATVVASDNICHM